MRRRAGVTFVFTLIVLASAFGPGPWWLWFAILPASFVSMICLYSFIWLTCGGPKDDPALAPWRLWNPFWKEQPRE